MVLSLPPKASSASSASLEGFDILQLQRCPGIRWEKWTYIKRPVCHARSYLKALKPCTPHVN
jgi:hypothetical protein